MKLADFIDRNAEAILSQWESFASSLLPAADGMDLAGLRDHAEQILRTISADLRTPQSAEQQVAKSKGHAPVAEGASDTAAQTHATARAHQGFSVRQMVAEYRALRASVLRLWAADAPYGPDAIEDIGRFNEAIDQAIAESVDAFTTEVDRWRALFLGVLGHDLRSPLNAVLMTSKVISSMSVGTPISEHTQRLIRSGERMARLLDDLLDYNRSALNVGVRVERARVNMAAVCRDELELLRAAIPASTLEFSTAGDTCGRWDPSRIRQMVSNLVTNAAKYGRTSGVIWVSVRADDSDVRLSVANTGKSIPRDQLKDLFEPLRRHATSDLHGERESLGLGLYIVRQIAEAHGGNIAVESEEGRTCFTVTLPKG
jgi:signal transduction histidine kinase